MLCWEDLKSMEKKTRDPWLYRLVIGSLACTVLTCTVGAIWLEAQGIPVPDVVKSMGTAALGALAGTLTPAP
jgi:hypothetical protein